MVAQRYVPGKKNEIIDPDMIADPDPLGCVYARFPADQYIFPDSCETEQIQFLTPQKRIHCAPSSRFITSIRSRFMPSYDKQSQADVHNLSTLFA
jgi:hypothetical protein